MSGPKFAINCHFWATKSESQVISSAQIRAARAAIGWSAEELVAASGVSRRTLGSVESAVGIPSANIQTLLKIQRALEAQGIEFIGSPDNSPGILIHPKPRS
jgi:transcriptional regulator with XRE-family HTH domain